MGARVAGLVLAAGRSARFGADKLLAPLAGRPVVTWSIAAIGAATDHVLVVLPPGAAALAGALHQDHGMSAGRSVRIVENPSRDLGMASSIAAGVASLDAGVGAVIIALGDQPLVSPDVVRRLVARWQLGGALAVAPRYRDGQGHPVLFGRACFAALCALEGDRGARSVLTALGDDLAMVEVDEPTPLDVDSPDVLERLERLVERLTRERTANPDSSRDGG